MLGEATGVPHIGVVARQCVCLHMGMMASRFACLTMTPRGNIRPFLFLPVVVEREEVWGLDGRALLHQGAQDSIHGALENTLAYDASFAGNIASMVEALLSSRETMGKDSPLEGPERLVKELSLLDDDLRELREQAIAPVIPTLT